MYVVKIGASSETDLNFPRISPKPSLFSYFLIFSDWFRQLVKIFGQLRILSCAGLPKNPAGRFSRCFQLKFFLRRFNTKWHKKFSLWRLFCVTLTSL